VEVHEGQARDGESLAGAAGAPAAQAHLAPLGVAVDDDLRVQRHSRRGETRQHDGERGQEQAGLTGKGHRQG
jgi:hypothetical protein